MSTRCAFGVGCFHFGYRKSTPYNFTTSDYVADVKKALEALSSLSELDITHFEDTAYSFEVNEDLTDLADGDYFPHVDGLEIRFKLFIPFRVQSELFPGEADMLRTSTETFRITCIHTFKGPVTFIECLDPGEDCRPSGSVRLLRVYLAREFNKHATSVTFERLGPSPFHANFYLEPSADKMEGIELEETKLRGYNKIVFRHSGKLSLEDVLGDVYDELRHELGLFYDIQRRSVRLMRQVERLTQAWQALLSITDPGPRFYDVRTRIRVHRDAQALVSDAYSLQAQYAFEDRQSMEDITSTYDSGTRTYLETYVRDNHNKLPTYPIESIIKWAEHVEGASFKQAEIAAMIVSALGGGVVGSLITLLASSGK